MENKLEACLGSLARIKRELGKMTSTIKDPEVQDAISRLVISVHSAENRIKSRLSKLKREQ